MSDNPEAEAGQRAEKHDGEDGRSVAGHRDTAAQFGDDHQKAGGDGEYQSHGSGVEQQLDRKIREVENAVHAVAQLLAEGPRALALDRKSVV